MRLYMTRDEMISKAREAKNAQELLTIAKENGIEMTEESAEAYFEQLHKTGELSDDELDNVSGGGCHAKDGRLVVTVANVCPLWTCKDCHRGCYGDFSRHACRTGLYLLQRTGTEHPVVCNTCLDVSYENGLWLCNHKENMK